MSEPPFNPHATLDRYQRVYDAAHPPQRQSAFRQALTLGGEQALATAFLGPVFGPGLVMGRAVYRRNSDCVAEALFRSEGRALDLLRQQFAGLDVDVIWGALRKVCQEIALYVGGGAVLGAVVGGAGGAAAGAGVLSIPAAGAGAAGGLLVGANLGLWVLTVIGLAHLVDYVGQALPEMADHYAKGFGQAWAAGELGPDETAKRAELMYRATERFAQGHVQLLIALLIGIVMYLTRGQLRKALLIDEIAASKLGKGFADWVARNEQELLTHPALQPQKTPGQVLQEMREQAARSASEGSIHQQEEGSRRRAS